MEKDKKRAGDGVKKRWTEKAKEGHESNGD